MTVRQVIPRDAIPSVEDPTFHEAYAGDPTDEVVVVDRGRVARAYPVRYLHYHEIVNDVVEGTAADDAAIPVAVTWCPLCGSAVVYDRRVSTAAGERTLEFGVSGKLADDDLVMYDRETESEWKQSLGRAIAGPLEGIDLTVLPAALSTWERFSAAHPDGVVMAPPGGESEAAGPGDDPAPVDYDTGPYDAYFAGEGFGLAAHRGEGERREWDRDDIDPKTVVLGVVRDGDARGFPLPVVREAGGVLTASVGGTALVVVAGVDGVHAFRDPGLTYAVTDAGVVADGAELDPVTGELADGRRLERVPARRLFAFAWQDDHGPESFHGL